MNDQLKDILEQQLRDVHAPDAVGWWPLAIGWWLVIVLVFSTLVFGLFKLRQHRRENAYRKIAIGELTQLFADWQQHQSNAEYLQSANAVVKRACSHFNRQAGSLSGRSWIESLNAHAKTQLSTETENALTQQLYQATPSCDIQHVHHELSVWLLRHSCKASVTEPNSASPAAGEPPKELDHA